MFSVSRWPQPGRYVDHSPPHKRVESVLAQASCAARTGDADDASDRLCVFASVCVCVRALYMY